MKVYSRKNPGFSLCGLNCCLCPRYTTTGSSRCPGCGGADFYDKHPSCAVITCSLRHDGVEYCFECEAYPCERYTRINDRDSFITYQHVPADMNTAKSQDLVSYLSQLTEKSVILDELLENWDNGRMKSYFCLAVNLLPLLDLQKVMVELEQWQQQLQDNVAINPSLLGKIAKEHIDQLAKDKSISLKLRR